MKNFTTAQIVQWICYSVPMIGLIVAFVTAPTPLTIVLLASVFLVAVLWIVFVAVYGR
jgi:hypothetical protein